MNISWIIGGSHIHIRPTFALLSQITNVRTISNTHCATVQCLCVQAYSSVYTVEQELKQELQKQEQAKQQKKDLEGRIHETELRIAKLTEKSQDSRQVS